MIGKIYSVNVSKKKGVSKTPVKSALLIKDCGFENDAHAEKAGIRQVSLLSMESIKNSSGDKRINPGDFAENITTEGIKLSGLKIGDKLIAGKEVVLEVSKIGKDCPKPCSIYHKLGSCIMPSEGIFAKVLNGGIIKIGDNLEVVENA